MPYPTITSRDVRAVQLSPELRRTLRKRAHNAAKREWAPVLAADRQAFQGIDRAYRNEAASVRGAAGMVQESLAQALAGLKRSGLQGNYLRQAANELTSRQADAASAIPFLLADAQQQRASALSDAQQQLRSDRASMLQSAESDFNTLLGSHREKGSSVLKEREEDARRRREEAAGSIYDPKNLANAGHALKVALRLWAKNPTIELDDGSTTTARQMNPLRSAADWQAFAARIDEQFAGFDLSDINEVIRRLLRDRKQKMRQGRLPQPGVPGPGRWAAR